MKTWWKTKVFKWGLGLLLSKVGLLFMVLVVVMATVESYQRQLTFLLTQESNPMETMNLSEEVLRYRSLVEQYCREFDIEEHVPIMLAIMQVESGGKGSDVMQSSESLGLPPNSLSPEASIQQGCRYFSQLLRIGEGYGVDLETVKQSYNFGGAFIPYVAQNGRSYHFELATQFSRMRSGGVQVTYHNPIAIEMNGGWRYRWGNMFYVLLLQPYLNQGTLIDGLALPLDPPFRVTCDFYCYPNHRGVDLSKAYGAPVKSVLDGTVIRVVDHFGSDSGWFGSPDGYGNVIFIEHEGDIITVYAHLMQTTLVQVGQQVKAGQTIGFQGNSGNSTGTHLHLEWLENGVPINPELRIQLR